MNKLVYIVTHAFDDHHVGKRLEAVDPSRVASNHVVPVNVSDKVKDVTTAKNTKPMVLEVEAPPKEIMSEERSK